MRPCGVRGSAGPVPPVPRALKRHPGRGGAPRQTLLHGAGEECSVKRIALVVTALALLGGARIAAAIPITPVCCACIPKAGWQTSGINQTTSIGALFCAQAPPADLSTLESRCEDTPDYTLECTQSLPLTPCAVQQAAAGVACPRAGGPAAGSSTLLALIIVLAAGGILAARLRRA